MSEESVDIEGWSLGEQLETGSKQIRGVRELQGWEYLQIVEDNTLLNSLTIGTDWTAVVDAWAKVSSAFTAVLATAQAGKEANEDVKTLNANLVQLLNNLQHHFRKFALAKKYLPADGLELEHFELAIHALGWEQNRALVDGTDWRAADSPLVQVLLLEKAPGRVEAAVALTVLAADALNLPRDGGPYSAERVFSGLLGASDRALSCLMASSRNAHEAACSRLRKSCLEVFADVPMIFKFKPKDSSEANIRMLQIRLDLIPVLHRGAVLGEGQIQELLTIAGQGQVGSSQGDAGDRHMENREMAGGESLGPPIEESDAGESAKNDARDDESSATATKAAETLEISSRAADLEGMMQEFAEISNELEERWSEALEIALDDAAVKAETVRWSAIVQTLWLETESRAKANSLHHVDNTVEIFPVPFERFREFSESATETERYRQSVVANLYTVKTLVETLRVLQVPVNESWEIESGARSKWWSSGGFTCVRDAARMAVRANAELNVIHERLLSELRSEKKPDEPEPGLEGYRESAFLAERALASGMPEAALFYLLKGAGQWHSATGRDLLSGPFLDEVRALLQGDLSGGSIPLGISVPLANMGLAEVREFHRRKEQTI